MFISWIVLPIHLKLVYIEIWQTDFERTLNLESISFDLLIFGNTAKLRNESSSHCCALTYETQLDREQLPKAINYQLLWKYWHVQAILNFHSNQRNVSSMMLCNEKQESALFQNVFGTERWFELIAQNNCNSKDWPKWTTFATWTKFWSYCTFQKFSRSIYWVSQTAALFIHAWGEFSKPTRAADVLFTNWGNWK